MLIKLTEAQCRAAMIQKDFGPDILGSEPSVAIALTQSWCPQWLWMKAWLPRAADLPGLGVYWVEYDREDFHESFMEFKENTYGNREIPYIRYYRNGEFLRDSNFIDKSAFLRILGR